MTLYDRHLAARFLGTYARILVSLFLLFVVIDFLTIRQDLVARHDVPWRIVAEFYLTLAPTILFEYQTAAVAVLIAALMVIGRAAELNEITALLAGGVRLWRIVRAPMVIALLIAGGTFAFEEGLGARITMRSDQLQREYFSEFSSKNRPGVSWANLKDGWNCHILKFNKRAMSGEDVFLHRITDAEVQEIRAGRIYWDPARAAWMLEDGTWARFNTNGEWTQQVTRITSVEAPFLETPDDLFALDTPAAAKSAWELRQDLLRAAARGVPVASGWVDLYAKFARPALAFVMILLAIPFAMRVRRGGIAVGFGMSIAIALSYLFVFYIGMGLGHLDKLEPLLAAWLANLIFFCGGLVLCYRTPT